MFKTLRNLFSRKVQSTPVVITEYCQSHVLQLRMKQKELSHDQTVMANLSPVRVESCCGKMIMYFCPLQNIEITQTLNPGDGGALPEIATIEGFSVPRTFMSGYYELKDVMLHSNGTLQVHATENTKIIPV